MSELTFNQVDQTVLNSLKPPGKSYWALIALLFAGVLMGASCWLYQIFVGVGVAGMNNPVAWGTYLINFVFWVGIAHSGTLISAILHLFRAGWRNPIARAAETMTVFAVCTAGLFPFIHLGRAWMVYFMLPFPNQRNLWPNFQSPLMFDVVAISTYLTVSSLFWYTGMLPDLAIVRDNATGLRKKIFTVLSMGWTGRFEQWRHYTRGYLFFACEALQYRAFRPLVSVTVFGQVRNGLPDRLQLLNPLVELRQEHLFVIRSHPRQLQSARFRNVLV